MYNLKSNLEGREEAFVNLYPIMKEQGFALGGGWEYDHGYMDKGMDEKQTVWIRIPFVVTHGTFQGDSPESDAIVQLGTPFLLRHLYKEGVDSDAQVSVASAMFNQFQSPVDEDAEIDKRWIPEAEQELDKLQQSLDSL